MRFMILVKANKDSEAGKMPSAELIAAMGRYNEEMLKAGVMLAGEGLKDTSQGVRLKFGTTKGAKPTVKNGPFTPVGEQLAGFWMVQVKSKQEAVDWAMHIPFTEGEEVEIRPVFEMEDFPADVMPPEEVAKEQKMREELDRRSRARS
jgi:hypothetical protein